MIIRHYYSQVIKINFLHAIIFLLYLSLNMQLLTIKGFQQTNIYFIKIYHVIFVCFFIYMLFRSKFKIVIIGNTVYLFYLVALVISIISYLFFDFNSLVFNYIFSFLIFVISTQLYKDSAYDILTTLKNAALVIFILVIIKNIIFFENIVLFVINPSGHPILPFFYGGGPNLESSWLAINTSLFIRAKNRTYYLIFIISIVISILYASRIGMIMTLVVFVLRLFSGIVNEKERKRVFILSIFLIIAFIVWFFPLLADLLFIFDRFLEIGSDAGSQGRLSMWKGVLPALKENFFGYGAGNSIYAIDPFVERKINEDNIHNYYIQNFIDFGMFGGILFLTIAVNRLINFDLNNPFYVASSAYFVGALLQYRGAEPIFWFLFALAIIFKNRFNKVNGK